MTTPTLYDLARAYLNEQTGGDRNEMVEFLLDDERRQAAFAKLPTAALAIDVFEEIFEEAQRDGFTFDEPDALKAEVTRRAQRPEAVDRLRQRLARVLN